jgi:hypothetical protein
MMGFPTHLLDGYRHVVLGVTDDQAKLIVFLTRDGIAGLADEVARRCPAAIVSRATETHYTIDHPSFQGDLTECGLMASTALLDVRAPELDVGKAFRALPAAVGRYVLSETGSLGFGVLAGLGAFAMVRHFAPAFASSGSRPSSRKWSP